MRSPSLDRPPLAPPLRRPLRLAFMGTPDFAVPTLAALAEAGHEVLRVYAQPPRPAGRGQKPRPSPVQAYADARGWPVRTPATLRDAAAQAGFAALDLDAAVVVAYGLLLPLPVLTAPRLGCFNVHASLLPRWRGAAPIQRALLAGDPETGVTIMRMDQGLDTGALLLQRRLSIGPAATAADLHDSLAALGAEAMVEVLAALEQGRLHGQPQPDEGVTYAAKLERREAWLDWRRPAEVLERQVRAFTPWPGALCVVPRSKSPESKGPGPRSEERLKVLSAAVAEGHGGPGGGDPGGDGRAGEPGTVLDDALTVACGSGALRLLRVQRQGKAAMDAAALLRGFPVAAGTRLTVPETGSGRDGAAQGAAQGGTAQEGAA